MTQCITKIPDSPQLEYYNQVTEKIIQGAKESIPKSDGYLKLGPVPWWNATCANLKRECIKAQKKKASHPTVTNKGNLQNKDVSQEQLN